MVPTKELHRENDLRVFLRPYHSTLSFAKMMGKKGTITAEDLASLRSRYHILDLFDLLAPSARETLRSHREGCICINERMLKAGVRISLEFGISELLSVFGAALI
ncbi:hypothetical protein ACLOJK_035149 [Asimina triloba]